jgi:acyl dehydratase
MMDVPERYFEDWKVGERFESGSLTLSEEQLVEFARAYDPQSFHIDAEAARATPFGGLIASGWQTAALSMRLLIESGAFGPKGGIGLGVDELRWPKPVFPGDTLHVLVEVAGTRASRAKRSGVVHFKLVTRNQRGEDVMTQTAIVLVQSRPEPAA